mgnify:CR=1 FL=1
MIPVYLSIKNPLVYDYKGRSYRDKSYAEILQQAIDGGHDGVILRNTYDSGPITHDARDETDIYVAFRPEQVKSATGNNGNFDPANPDIRFSRSAAPSLSEVAETGRDTAWTGPAASKWDDFIYKMQDKHIDTKRALEAVRATQQKILI